MRYFILFFSLAALTGCATNTVSPSQNYRAVGQTDQTSISATLRQRIGLLSVDNEVAIFVNGQRAAGGSFSGGSAEFSGMAGDKRLLADCTAAAANNLMYQLTYGIDRTDVKCTVFIGNERAASFLLVP